MAELVKIDPKSIGVGQYQHDMNQKKLGETLHGVVEDCVNKVGVDLNTASVSLLTYISGISSAIAKNIVSYREQHGRFTNRRQLLKVDKLGAKAFEQCAGFLRINGGDNPLDGTSVHPESYQATEQLMKKLKISPENIGNLAGLSKTIRNYGKLAQELDIGEPTLKDIVAELEKPARDPRDEMPKPILRSDVLEMKDLKEGMILKGTVRNVIDFGGVCGHWRTPGRFGAYFSTFRQKVCQTSVGSRKSWRRCGRESAWRGFAEETHFPYHDYLTLHEQRKSFAKKCL